MAVNVNNGTSLGEIVVLPLKGEKGDGVTQMQNELATLKAQIDQIIAPTGEAPNPAEITDARVGADGITYNTLGEAIRTNDNSLETEIEAVGNGYRVFAWVANGYVSKSDGAILNFTGWSYTDYIEIDDPIFRIIVKAEWGSSFNAFYDANKNFIGIFSWSNNIDTVNAPRNAKYFRLSVETEYTKSVYLEGKLKKVASTVKSLVDGTGITDPVIISGEYVSHTGEAIKENGWSRTDYIPCLDAVYIQFTTDHQTDYNAYYDADKKFIDYFTVVASENFNVRVPENARYFMISNQDSSIEAEVKSINHVAFGDLDSKVDYLSNFEIPVVMNRGGYIDRDNGELVQLANWSYSDFVPFDGGLLIYSNTHEENGSTYNAFYDKNKNFICNFSIFPNRKFDEIVAPLNAKYFRYSTGSFHTPEITFYLGSKNIDYNGDILRLNDKDTVGQRIIQSKMHFNPFDGSVIATKVLTLSVLTDIHAFNDEFKRYIRFTNAYKDYVDDKLCLGDVVRDNIAQDFTYWSNNADADDIMIVLGNHDASTNESGRYVIQPAKTCYDKYFLGLINDWHVTQPSGAEANGLCYYYKDYPQHNIRLIVLDCMHYTDEQNAWFTSVLEGARSAGKHVICAKHYNVSRDLTKISGNFYDPDLGFTKLVIGDTNNNKAQVAVNNFQLAGGYFVCWLTGDAHYDAIGQLTLNGKKQLCVTFENAGCHDVWGDDARVVGQKSEDSFNFVTVDTYSHLLKIVRVGNDMNRYLQPKKYLCYNYQTDEVISVD